jgi:hypothetical protein
MYKYKLNNKKLQTFSVWRVLLNPFELNRLAKLANGDPRLEDVVLGGSEVSAVDKAAKLPCRSECARLACPCAERTPTTIASIEDTVTCLISVHVLSLFVCLCVLCCPNLNLPHPS